MKMQLPLSTGGKPAEIVPRVSILIPNYNNGPSSSITGRRDFISDLLNSLRTTLADDPTPFEVLAFDDGSTDESIDTLRRWAGLERWPDGRPFLSLTEAPHCGRLSVTANRLCRMARGEFLARLDGDIFCLTPKWVSRICSIFDSGPENLGIIGPKQLNLEGRIHEFGDWLLHPNGYHHNAHGMERFAVKRAMEVDDTMGCFHVCRKLLYNDIGGYDEDFLRGQTVDFGVRARLNGWRCWAVPDIEYVHAHADRRQRETLADSQEGMQEAFDVFERKWGFNRLAPDLDEVRERYRGTPLLWNARWFGPSALDCEVVTVGTLTPEQTVWAQYARNPEVKQKIDLRVQAVADVIRQIGPRRLIAQVGSDCGLIGHMIAARGWRYVGCDRREAFVRLSALMTAQEKYPDNPPLFVHQSDRRRLPFTDRSADMLLLADCLETHPNPVGLIKEVRRVLMDDGLLLVVSRRRIPRVEHIEDQAHDFDLPMLMKQLVVVGGFSPVTDPSKDDLSRPDFLAAFKREREAPHAAAGQISVPGKAQVAHPSGSFADIPAQPSLAGRGV